MTDQKKPREFWAVIRPKSVQLLECHPRFPIRKDQEVVHVREVLDPDPRDEEIVARDVLLMGKDERIAELEKQNTILQKCADLYDLRTAERNTANEKIAKLESKLKAKEELIRKKDEALDAIKHRAQSAIRLIAREALALKEEA